MTTDQLQFALAFTPSARRPKPCLRPCLPVDAPGSAPRRSAAINTLQTEDRPVHEWYRFVLSFPPHLVRQCLEACAPAPGGWVLDPFCGTGTTLVECKKQGIPSLGCDAHPFAALVSRVKTDWSLDTSDLGHALRRILRRSDLARRPASRKPFTWPPHRPETEDRPEPLADTPASLDAWLSEAEAKLLPEGFLSPRPLERLVRLRDLILEETAAEPVALREFFLVALAHVIANGAGNFAFGPEIFRTRPKPDYDVCGHFARQADAMMTDLAAIHAAGLETTPSRVLHTDARTLQDVPDDLAAVITSPPYPNEKDYTRTTRVESILLRLVSDRATLRHVKQSLLRSNTRNVFSQDRDEEEVQEFASIRAVCEAIERRRVELGKTSGFEKLYPRVVGHYFGGLRRHLRALRPKLRPRARLAYVVGDQLSFLQVPVATGCLLEEVAAAEGYRTLRRDLWRERVGTKARHATATGQSLRIREEILLLEKT
ncbi:MAG: hypothetical protein HS113_25715 [Verrucomicrobiales bacterium]|nr:hypothetical protein [Verrucomicrobiales bacterium]